MAAELQEFMDLMMFLVSSWEISWNGHDLTTDADETEWGICRAIYQQVSVISVDRVRERDRYLSSAHVSTRVDVLGSNSLPSQMSQNVYEGSPTGQELIEDPVFKEGSHEILDPTDWKTLCVRTFNHTVTGTRENRVHGVRLKATVDALRQDFSHREMTQSIVQDSCDHPTHF